MSDEETEKLSQDEVVCYIARRHHTTPHNILHRFQQQNTRCSAPASDGNAAGFRLEDNEMEILRNLSGIKSSE